MPTEAEMLDAANKPPNQRTPYEQALVSNSKLQSVRNTDFKARQTAKVGRRS
jgi:hypothetical protein